ncbi:DctP family TRAP transporter solute-binding subunit [Salipaludibacillus daqingensis]|uniref:DctP family TRAP transporter solute-binding subunit n=1 Tax=Salipaludibacillus daqingensis TaxID=3041001 RepID=UPI0024740B63|nr:DctP family TRAP transporter solute-binding subunit [Salipaludibacillus daqingensis]
MLNKLLKFSFFTMILSGLIACGGEGSVGDGQEQTKNQSVTEEEFTIRFSFVNAAMSVKGMAADKFADLVDEKTDGRVKVEVYPAAQLYNDDESFEAIVGGNLEMIAPAVTKLVTFDPRWQYVDLPFLFKDHDHVMTFFESELAEDLLNSEQIIRNNLEGKAFWQNGFKQFTTSDQPLRGPEDFEGLNFRVQAGSVLDSFYQKLGAGTATISLGESYAALQQGTVDGTENTFNNIDTLNYEEVQDYLTVSNHGRIDWAILVNKSFWDEMPTDVRDQVDEALEEATQFANKITQEENEKSFEKIKAAGNLEVIELTEEERAKLIDTLDPLYEEFESIITKDLIEGIRSLEN